jgi:ATP-binding cassette subfamily B protein
MTMAGGPPRVRDGAPPDGDPPHPAAHIPERTPAEGFSVYDHIRPPPEARSLQRLPGLAAGAIRLVWRAGRREFIASALLQTLGAVGIALQVLVGRRVLADLLIAQRDAGALTSVLPAVGLLGGVMLLVGLASAAQAELGRVLTELVSKEAAGDVLDAACAVDLAAFERPAFHDRLARAKFNAANRPLMAVNGLVGVLGGVLGAIGASVALFAIQPLLVPAGLIGLIPLWLVASRNSRQYYALALELTPSDRERTYLYNLLTHQDQAKEVRAFSLAGFLRHRHDTLYEHRLARVRQLTAIRLRRSLGATVATTTLTIGVLAALGELLLTRRLSLAAAGAAVWGVLYLAQQTGSIIASAGSLYESALFIEDVNGFLKLKPHVEAARATTPAPEGFERLVVDDLTFTYPGSRGPALEGVSLKVDRGAVVALVGENGAGKTTLAKLLAGLYRPDAGRILWDGTDVTICDPVSVRRSVAVVFQDFVRYQMPARDNIGMGRVERIDDLEGIAAAARQADADGYLSQLPRGYDTVLSRMWTGGRDLSIGQWQRVALARAFFRNAPFVIMDEPTAALDARAESLLFKQIRRILDGRTVLLISHRFSSVRMADRIYVLHAGRVVEGGTHDELVGEDGRYAHLWRLQAAAYQESGPGRGNRAD